MQVTPGSARSLLVEPHISDPSPVPEQTLKLELGRGDLSLWNPHPAPEPCSSLGFHAWRTDHQILTKDVPVAG